MQCSVPFYIRDLVFVKGLGTSPTQGPLNLRESQNLYMDFQLCRGLAPLTSCIVQWPTIFVYVCVHVCIICNVMFTYKHIFVY